MHCSEAYDLHARLYFSENLLLVKVINLKKLISNLMLPLREAFCFQAVGEVCVRVCVLSSVIIYCARYLINRS